MANARLTDHVSRVLGVAWFVLAVAGVVADRRTRWSTSGRCELADVRTRSPATYVSIVANVGTYLISLAVLGLVLLGVQTYRNARVRRTVGIIWDLATFWPRGVASAGPAVLRRAGRARTRAPGHLARHRAGRAGAVRAQPGLGAGRRHRAAAAAARRGPGPRCSPTARRSAGSTCGPSRTTSTRRSSTTSAPPWPDRAGRSAGSTCGAAPTRSAAPSASATGGWPTRSSFDPLPGDRIPPGRQAHSGYQLTPQFGQAMDDLVGTAAPVTASAGTGRAGTRGSLDAICASSDSADRRGPAERALVRTGPGRRTGRNCRPGVGRGDRGPAPAAAQPDDHQPDRDAETTSHGNSQPARSGPP